MKGKSWHSHSDDDETDLKELCKLNSTKQCCSWKVDQLTPVPGFVGHRLRKFRAVFYLPCSSLKASIYFLKLWVPVERYEVYIPDTQTTYTDWAVCLLSTQLRAEEFLGLLEEHRRLQRQQALRWMRIPKSLQRQIRNILFIITNQKPEPMYSVLFQTALPSPHIFIKEMQTHVLQDG